MEGKMEGVRMSTLNKMKSFELIAKVAELSNDQHDLTIKSQTDKYLAVLSKRFGISTMQTLLLCVFVDQCDDSRIRYRDLARHFDCRTVSLLAHEEDIDELVRLGVVARKKDKDGDVSFRVPRATLDAIRQNKLPEKEKIDGLSIRSWIDVLDGMLHLRENEEVSDEDLEARLQALIEKNQHLHLARLLKAMALPYTDLLLFLAMSMLYINNHDDRICRGDIDDYFDRGDLRSHCEDLEDGSHTLMNALLVEHSCVDGQIETNHWRLTNYSKYELFAELNLKQPVNVRSNLMHHEDVKEKKLYYTPSVSRQVEQLHSLMECDKMQSVLQRLEKKGMRKGFTCLFYGAPGTGKTETVMQLARMTKRDIMLIDIPSIRSKWVGETEKNIKEVFERYRKAVGSAKDGNHPILLFNEADAILNKRNEGGVNAVDKMENAMQNIILQEMENLEGIMIATTNLTGSLDDAFERRFLFKVEFDKPTPKERQHIWKAMLPDLMDEQALTLAERFDFSGGQIENIARKRVISDILNDRDDIDMDSLIESCKAELLNKKNQRSPIGF